MDRHRFAGGRVDRLHLLIGALLVLLVGTAAAETIGASSSVQTVGNNQFWQINNRVCSATERIPATGFIYATASEAAAAISQAYLDWGAKHNYGNCTSTTLRAVRGAFTESANSGALYAAIYDGNTLLNSSMQVGAVTKGGTGCPSGWVTSGSNCTRTVYSCPATGGWLLSGESCVREDQKCPAGQELGYLGIACVPSDTCQTQTAALGNSELMVIGRPSVVCDRGCTIRPTTFRQGADGRSIVGPPYVVVGGVGSCGPADASATAPPLAASAPVGLGAGKCPGVVNGAAVSVDCASSGTQTVTSATNTSTSASGVSSTGARIETSTSTACPPSGGACQTIVITTTINPDGSRSSSTTTSTGPGGNGTGNSGTGTGSGNGQEGSSFGGSCAATTCSGDAIQCQIAREQARRACELLDATDASARGIAAAAAGDKPGDHPGASANVTSVAVASSFDQTDLIGGSCPADVVVPLGAGSVVLPFSRLCSPATWLGNLLVGITALACLGIALGTKGAS